MSGSVVLSSGRSQSIALPVYSLALLSHYGYVSGSDITNAFISIYDCVHCALVSVSLNTIESVSYTHLDVYKRQRLLSACKWRFIQVKFEVLW